MADLDEKSVSFTDQDRTSTRGNATSEWTSTLIFISLTTVLSSLTYGYNITVIDAPKLIFGKCRNPDLIAAFLPSCMRVGDRLWGIVVASFCAGGLVGALSCSYLATRFGRKRVLMFNNVLYLGGAACFALAVSPWMLIAGRFMSGLAGGVCTVVVPMYLSEISTDRIRGAICSFHQFAIVVGILFGQLAALLLATESGWRLLFSIGGLAAAAQMALMPMCPESPKYLKQLGKTLEAQEVLNKLRKSHHDQQKDLEQDNNSSINDENVQEGFLSVKQLVMLPAARKSLLVGILYHGIQQFSGINVFFYFSNTIFAGINVKSQYLAIVICIFNLLMTGISLWLMDRKGRRPLSLVSTGIMAMSCLGLTLGFLLSWSVLVIISALAFVCSFAVGLGPVPWVILQDIFPPSAVNAGTSIGMGVNWTCNMLVALAVLPLVKLFGVSFVFVPFGVLLACFFVFNWTAIPETKGKPSNYL